MASFNSGLSENVAGAIVILLDFLGEVVGDFCDGGIDVG